MPNIDCAICKQREFIGIGSWKLLDVTGGFVCGPECLIRWIEEKTVPEIFRGWQDLMAQRLPEQKPVQWRSEYEKWVSLWLTREGYAWEFERWRFPLGAKRSYTPDFYLPKYGVFLEVKGQWGIGQKTKLKLFRRRNPGVPLIVIPWTLSERFYPESAIQRQRGQELSRI